MKPASHHYQVFETAMGFCAVAWSGPAIVCFRLPTTSAQSAERLILRRMPDASPGEPPAPIKKVIASVQRYFEGEKADFSACEVDLGVQEAFFRDVYEHVRKLGFG